MYSLHQPIRLRTDGPDIVVEIDFGVKNADGDSYVEVIREKLYGPKDEFEISHEVLAGGIEAAKSRHYNPQR